MFKNIIKLFVFIGFGVGACLAAMENPTPIVKGVSFCAADGSPALKGKIQKILSQTDNPQIIVWFSGEDGLSIRGVDFYNKNLIKRLEQKRLTYNLYLYDLYAWVGLKGDAQRLFACNPILKNTPKNPLVSFLYSANFFLGLFDARDKDFFASIFQTLERKFIFDCSQKYIQMDPLKYLNKRSFLDIGSKIESVPEFLMQTENAAKDTGLLYSALQYLEGLWLTREIVRTNIFRGNRSINIIFLLPKGESTYYRPSNGNSEYFRSDLEYFLRTDLRILQLADLNITVCFKEFEYSANGTSRPYVWVPCKDQLATESDLYSGGLI